MSEGVSRRPGGSVWMPIVGAALIVGFLLLVVTFGPRSTSASAETGEISAAAVLEVSPLFNVAQMKTDKLPSFLTDGAQSLEGIGEDSTRFLGEQDGIKYWIAARSSNEMCLISLLPGRDQFAAMSCQLIDTIWNSGIGLQFADSRYNVRAYLLPNGFDAKVDGFTTLGTQLLLGSGERDSVKEMLVAPQSTSKHRDALQLIPFHAISQGG